MRISDWSSDVCSSDLNDPGRRDERAKRDHAGGEEVQPLADLGNAEQHHAQKPGLQEEGGEHLIGHQRPDHRARLVREHRSEEHTSELQSLMRISYAVFCLKKKKKQTINKQKVKNNVNKRKKTLSTNKLR